MFCVNVRLTKKTPTFPKDFQYLEKHQTNPYTRTEHDNNLFII